jgi:CRISPR-associated protein Cmr5
MSLLQTKEQERAGAAWDCVDNVNKLPDEKFKKEYRSNALKLPSLILTNGLGQTLAFLKSKGKRDLSKSEEKVYRDLEDWLKRPGVINWGTAQGELIERIMKINSDKYRLVTTETLAFINWLKRFADAALPKDGGE